MDAVATCKTLVILGQVAGRLSRCLARTLPIKKAGRPLGSAGRSLGEVVLVRDDIHLIVTRCKAGQRQ